ncbi:MAG: TIGR02452 family protein [Bacteroidia bacterium]
MNTMNRKQRIFLAQETLSILRSGTYLNPKGETVSIADAQQAAKQGTKVFRPEALDDLDKEIEKRLETLNHKTHIEVVRTDSLSAAAPLTTQYRTLVHNFASARNPGGGFLTGAQAQEEDLSRNSGLYPCLKERAQVFYNENRKSGTAFYTDHVVYSPQVPVFRDQEGIVLEKPYQVDFITIPAVNAGAVHKNEKHHIEDIESVMRGRLFYFLGIAMLEGAEAIVTGAWGCGVFQNDPAMIAGLFKEMLNKGGVYSKAFKHVSFAVLDKMEHGKFIGPFEQVFGEN